MIITCSPSYAIQPCAAWPSGPGTAGGAVRAQCPHCSRHVAASAASPSFSIGRARPGCAQSPLPRSLFPERAPQQPAQRAWARACGPASPSPEGSPGRGRAGAGRTRGLDRWLPIERGAPCEPASRSGSRLPLAWRRKAPPLRLGMRFAGMRGPMRVAILDGPCWARTSDLRLVEPALSQLS
jgi:hypothetical protein